MPDGPTLGERLQAVVDNSECTSGGGCTSLDFCDECAVRWDTEAALILLGGVAARARAIQRRHGDAIAKGNAPRDVIDTYNDAGAIAEAVGL